MDTTSFAIGDAVADALFPITQHMDVLSQLTAWRSAASVVEQQMESLVRDAREQESSWAQIGLALGVSKQAAQQRFGRADLGIGHVLTPGGRAACDKCDPGVGHNA